MANRSLLLLSIVLVALPCSWAVIETFTNSWAVEVKGGVEAADNMASKYGFINKGQVGNIEDMYHFVMPAHTLAGKRSLSGLPVYSLSGALKSEPNVGYVQQQVVLELVKMSYREPTDPQWNDQWQLLNTGQLNASDAGRDSNVERAWLQGITGCGVTVAVVDDGVEYTHPDLEANYDSSLQIDVAYGDNDPFPMMVEGVRDSHGTSCAGEIAMAKSNDNCGVGVAYNSRITGILLLGGEQTEITAANALSHRQEHIAISSNSWGPLGHGRVVAAPGPLIQMVIETAARNGRSNRGTIFVFSTGNGGFVGDSCAFNGIASNVYTIGIGSVNSNGEQAFYDVDCAGKMAVTYTADPYISLSNYSNGQHVTTTGAEGICYSSFVGTSASAPIASGIFALTVEANVDLSLRDVQYLVVYTSRRDQLVDGEWITNGAGIQVSQKFGFGALDAEAMVTRARHWITVPERQITKTGEVYNRLINPAASSNEIVATVSSDDVVFLEHVVVNVSLWFPDVDPDSAPSYEYYDGNNTENLDPGAFRGNIQLELTSPSGTTSIIMPYRLPDVTSDPIEGFPFTTVQFWGESPIGDWTIIIRNDNTFVNASINVTINSIEFYGAGEVPAAVSRIPSQCHASCDPARSCAAPGPDFCDGCANLRNATTLECIDSCEGMAQRNGYCYDDSVEEAVCAGAPPMSPYGLLIAVSLLATLLSVWF